LRIRIWYDRGTAAAWGWTFPPEMMRVAEDRREMGDTDLMWQDILNNPSS
jgi:hypothetical protein